MPGPLNHSALAAQSQQTSSQAANGTPSQNIQSSAGQNVMLNALPAAQDPVAITQNQQATSSPPYYADQQPASQSSQAQQINSTDGQLSASLASSPISPHLQQPNGYPATGNGSAATAVTGTPVTGNGQLQNYTTQQQQQQPPSNSAQGTWTGQNTLSYTQSIQPPDPRSSHNSYCKSIVIAFGCAKNNCIFLFVCTCRASWKSDDKYRCSWSNPFTVATTGSGILVLGSLFRIGYTSRRNIQSTIEQTKCNH